MSKFHKAVAPMLAVMLIAGVAFALNERGNINFTGKFALRGVEVTATATELNLNDGQTATTAEVNSVCDGNTATAAEITLAADVSVNRTTANLTNNATLTLAATSLSYVLSGTDGGNLTTNTFALGQPYPTALIGHEVILAAASGTTNLLKLDDSSAVLALGGNIELGPTDTIKIYINATNEAFRTAGVSNN